MSGQHSKCPPSAASIWGNCSAAIPAIAAAPGKDTCQSREGTAAHWVGSEILSKVTEPWASEPAANYLGVMSPEGVKIDDKMVQGAQEYVNDVLARFAEMPGAVLAVERRMVASRIHPENWGTYDCALVDMANRRIVLFDYKHGHGRVDAKGNLQMTDYLVGILEEVRRGGGVAYEDMLWFVEFRIVQPYCFTRPGSVDVWTGMGSDVKADVNRLADKAAEGLGPNPRATPGAHCRYCPGRVGCGTADQYTSHIIDVCRGAADLSELTGHELATMRDILTDGQLIVKARLDAINETLEHMVSEGDTSAGLVIKSVQGNKGYWRIPDAQVIALGGQFGTDLRKDGCITPKQALDKMPADKKEIWEKVAKPLSFKKSSTQLINASDTLAARTFGVQK